MSVSELYREHDVSVQTARPFSSFPLVVTFASHGAVARSCDSRSITVLPIMSFPFQTEPPKVEERTVSSQSC